MFFDVQLAAQGIYLDPEAHSAVGTWILSATLSIPRLRKEEICLSLSVFTLEYWGSLY